VLLGDGPSGASAKGPCLPPVLESYAVDPTASSSDWPLTQEAASLSASFEPLTQDAPGSTMAAKTASTTHHLRTFLRGLGIELSPRFFVCDAR